MGDGGLLAVVGLMSALIATVGAGLVVLLKSQDAKNTRQQDALEAAHAEERRIAAERAAQDRKDAADRAMAAAAEAAKRETTLIGLVAEFKDSFKDVANSNLAVAESLKSMGAAVEHKTDVLQQQVMITGTLAEEIKKIDRIKEKDA